MKYRILFLWMFCMSFLMQAQTQTQGKAKALYSKGEYREAIPAIRNELKTKPKDANLNFWYGVCLLETRNSEMALPYLEFARDNHITEANRYLVKYYLAISCPDSALIYFNKYLETVKADPKKRASTLALKDSIESQISQLKKVEDICFIDSIIVPKSALFSTIKLSPEAGKLMPADSAFPKEPKTSGGAYFPERNDRIYYAKTIPGKNLDIVARHLILNDWGKVEPLPDIINTEADECNPFYLSDGVTLYFASNGHGSMGGYDLFVTRFDKTTGNYLRPDHLNMPFNSKANDYFYIVDEFNHRGYLATDRNQPEGYVAIYTFIPNDSVTMIEGKSEKELESFAQIRSIKATWEGKDMDALLHKKKAPAASSVKEKDNDMTFIINDSLSYSKPSDFKSAEARREYINYSSKNKKYLLQKKILEDKRQQYLQASPELQAQLNADILKMEKENLALEEELPVLEKKIRNLEITELSK